MRTGSFSFVCRWAAALAAASSSMSAVDAIAAPTIQHNPIGYFVPDKRIRLDAQMADSQGLKFTRAYFKADTQADFLFVPMNAQPASRNYTGILPAPAAGTSSIEYVFLAVNSADEVVKTATYTAIVRRTNETPGWQNLRQEGRIQVWAEAPNTPAPTASFSDSISMNVAESAARFGAVAGIGKGVAGGAGSSAAESSASTSSTTGTTTGASSGAATGVAVGTVAIVGGLALAAAAAAAAGGGGGGSSSSGGTYACSIRQCSREQTTGQCFCSGSSNTTCPSGLPTSTGGACNLTPSGGGQVTSCPVGSSCLINFINGNFNSIFCSTTC